MHMHVYLYVCIHCIFSEASSVLAAFKKAEKHVCCTAKQIDKTNKVESKCGRISVCVRLLVCVCVCVCCCCVGFKAVIMCSQSVRQGDNSSAL